MKVPPGGMALKCQPVFHNDARQKHMYLRVEHQTGTHLNSFHNFPQRSCQEFEFQELTSEAEKLVAQLQLQQGGL